MGSGSSKSRILKCFQLPHSKTHATGLHAIRLSDESWPSQFSHLIGMRTTSTVVGEHLYAAGTINHVLSTYDHWVGRGHLVSYKSGSDMEP